MRTGILAIVLTWSLLSYAFPVLGGDPPRFVSTNFTDLGNIEKISRFRSCAGHDFSFGSYGESCRSMKHYYQPKGDLDWSTIEVRSPVHGTVTGLLEEWAGTKVEIRSSQYPDYYFSIFHIDLDQPLSVGDTVVENQLLGNHIGNQTIMDIAVVMQTQDAPPNDWQLISYFNVMTESLFALYQARGIASLEEVIISRAERDADPCTCTGGAGSTFSATGTLQIWVPLSNGVIRKFPPSLLILLLD